MKLLTITSTTDSQQVADDIAKLVVQQRLAACVQIDGPIQSVYFWQGQLCEGAEYRLICKTTPEYAQALVDLIQHQHPYELPEILIAEVRATPEYYQWVVSQLTAGDGTAAS